MKRQCVLSIIACFQSLIGILAAMWGTGILAQSIPYQPGFGAKQMAWILHSGVLGAVVAPLCFLGGPLLVRAAVYTAGMVAGKLAACLPCLLQSGEV